MTWYSEDAVIRLPTQPWLKIVFLILAAVFLGEVVYVYGVRFSEWIESDASVTVLFAAKVLKARSPIVHDWYYASGAIWLIAPHLLAILPVAIGGVGPKSLLVAVVVGFAIETFVFVRLYRRLCGETWIAVLATMATLIAWSPAHVAFVYVQLAYGFLAALYALIYGAWAVLTASEGAVRPSRWAGAATFFAIVSLESPVRGFVFLLLPLVVSSLWPWKGVPLARRATGAGIAVAAWSMGYLAYSVLKHSVTFSIPKGHDDFAVKSVAGITDNLAMLMRGVALLSGGQISARAIPGALLIVGAVAFLVREVVRARELTAHRFFTVAVGGQLAITLFPLIVGNLLVSPSSARYLLPSLLLAFGLAVIHAVRALEENGWRKHVAMGWLCLSPIAAVLALPSTQPPTPTPYVWPKIADHEQIANELAKRNLTHGYSSVLNSNFLNLMTHGQATTCPVFFSHVLVPQRWLADTRCFTPSALPERFFIVTDHDPRDQAALQATLPPPAERFAAGTTYDVSVYRTAEVPLKWLELPLLDGDDATFPMRLSSTHLQLHRGLVEESEGRMIGIGGHGYILFGPYMRLPRGDYELRWFGSGVDSPGEITFRVASDVGKKVEAEQTIQTKDLRRERGELVHLSFSLHSNTNAVEFTVFSNAGGRVALDEVLLEKR